MRLSITAVPAAFALGATLLQICPELPDHTAIAAALALSFALAVAAAWLARPGAEGSTLRVLRAGTHAPRASGGGIPVGPMLACVFALLCGFGYAALRAELRLTDALPFAWENRDMRLRGIVDSLPQRSADATRFAFAVEEVLTPGASAPRRLSLAWFAPGPVTRPGSSFVATPRAAPEARQAAPEVLRAAPEIHAGERWTLTVRLKRPHGNVNPHGFDLEAWLLERNLRATGYVRDAGPALRELAFAGRPSDYVERAREAIRTRIATTLGEGADAGVLTALTIGDQDAVSNEQWQIFNRTGVTHLISISGLHVTVFAALAGIAILAAVRRSSVITSRIPARKLATLCGVFAAWGYVLLAGAEVPAVRTLLMLAIAAAGLWLNRPGTAPAIWLWSLAAVLLADPWAPLAPGFWLSFGAVGLLLYACAARLPAVAAAHVGSGAALRVRLALRTCVALREAARLQWVVTLGLIPGTLAWFQQVSVVSLVANAVAIPVVSFAVVPLALAGIGMPIDLPWRLAQALLHYLLRWLEWLSSWPWAAWGSHAPTAWTLVAAVAGVLWVLAPRGVPGRPLGGVLMLPMILLAPPAPAPGAVRATVLDVGQGLAVLVETERHALLYDAGPRHRTGDAGIRVILPYLRATGVTHLERLVVSHADSDHSGGVSSILAALPVGLVLSSMEPATLQGEGRAAPRDSAPPARAPPVARTPPTGGAPTGGAPTGGAPAAGAPAAGAPAPAWQRCRSGDRWEWDGVRFEILHPREQDYGEPGRKTNDLSCVLVVTTAAGSLLLTGDIEARAESEILTRDAARLAADVLVVPHHGSLTSSTPAFIAAVAPRTAVVAAGYLNRFGHPRPAVLERYQRAGIPVLRTDLGGALAFELAPGRELAISPERARRRRYWYDRGRRYRYDVGCRDRYDRHRWRRVAVNRRSGRCAPQSHRSGDGATA